MYSRSKATIVLPKYGFTLNPDGATWSPVFWIASPIRLFFPLTSLVEVMLRPRRVLFENRLWPHNFFLPLPCEDVVSPPSVLVVEGILHFLFVALC